MRYFTYSAFDNEAPMDLPMPGAIETELNGRALAIILFQKVFGRCPSRSWGSGKVGEAEAWNRRKQKIRVQQWHHAITGYGFRISAAQLAQEQRAGHAQTT